MSGYNANDYLWDVTPCWLAEIYFDLEEQTVSSFNISNFQQTTQHQPPEDSNLYCCSEIQILKK
jgi:hypothetical protein